MCRLVSPFSKYRIQGERKNLVSYMFAKISPVVLYMPYLWYYGFWVKLKGSNLIFVKIPDLLMKKSKKSHESQFNFKKKSWWGGDPDTSQERCLRGRTRNWPVSFKCVSSGDERWNCQDDPESEQLKRFKIKRLKRDCYEAGLLLCIFGSKTITDAYYSVKSHPSSTKFFRFMF